jgi:spore germination protein GerM
MRGRWTLRVGALAALAVLTCACGVPTAGSPTPIARSAVPFHLLDPVSVTTAPPAPFVGVTESIFLVAADQRLVAVHREVQIPASAADVVRALLDGPTTTESGAGLQTYLSPTPQDVTATQDGTVVTVDFADNPVAVVGADQVVAVAQIVYTVTQQAGPTTRVLIEVQGHPTPVPTAGGAQVTGPVGRAQYAPEAPAT